MGKDRPGPVRESTGLALAHTNPMVAHTKPAQVQNGFALGVIRSARTKDGRFQMVPALTLIPN